MYVHKAGGFLNTVVDHVFTNIMETRHILRLRRNIVKLQFYNHLIYMLIFTILGQHYSYICNMSLCTFVHHILKAFLSALKIINIHLIVISDTRVFVSY